MAITLKNSGKAAAVPAGLAAGAVVSTSITLVLAALLALMVDTEHLAWENIGYGIMVLVFLSAFAGSLTAWGRIRRQKVLVCAASGLIYLGILLSITALFFGGQYQAVGVTAALVLAGCGCAVLLGLGGGRPKKGRRIRRRHR